MPPAGKPIVGLTPRQRDVLAYLQQNPDASLAEIRDAFGWKGLGVVSQVLNGLQERGHIFRLRRRARSTLVFTQPQERDVFIRGERFRFIPKTRAEG